MSEHQYRNRSMNPISEMLRSSNFDVVNWSEPCVPPGANINFADTDRLARFIRDAIVALEDNAPVGHIIISTWAPKFNALGIDGMLPLVEALGKNTSVKKLTLSCFGGSADRPNFTSDEVNVLTNAITEALFVNHTLMECEMFYDNQLIDELLEMNKNGPIGALLLKTAKRNQPFPLCFLKSVSRSVAPEAIFRSGTLAGVDGIYMFLKEEHAEIVDK